MFSAIVRSQWAFSRTTVLTFAVLAFVTPMAAVIFAPLAGSDPAALVLSGELAGMVTLCTMGLVSLSLAAHSWSIDARLGHVYALSLPISRGRYVSYRLLAVCLLLAVVALALLLGAFASGALLELPPTLHLYPVALTIRALLAGWLIASAIIALRFGSGDRIAVVILVLLVLAVSVPVVLSLSTGGRLVLTSIVDFVRLHPGPLGLILGRWTLIDV